MADRSTRTTVRFAAAFTIPGVGSGLPAGEYHVDSDEDQIEGLSFSAWRRTGCFIHLPAIGTTGGMQQMVPVDPGALDAAIERDQGPRQ